VRPLRFAIGVGINVVFALPNQRKAAEPISDDASSTVSARADATMESRTPKLERRHSRLLRVASLLDADNQTEPDVIAKQIGISRRTLFRDLAILRRSGVHLAYSREERRYRLESLHARVMSALSQPEAAAFLDWVIRRASAVGEKPSPFDKAVEKIARILADELNPAASDHRAAGE